MNQKDYEMITTELNILAEGYKEQMSVNVYNYIQNIVQSIEQDNKVVSEKQNG